MMAWDTSPNQIKNIFSSLFVQHGDNIRINEKCLSNLETIYSTLLEEDCTSRTFFRTIGVGQYIQKYLIPLLVHVKNDPKNPNFIKIIDTTIKILVNLTIPTGISRTEVENSTISQLLTLSKKAFSDIKTTKALVDHMKFIVESHSQLNMEECDSINNCLLLLRNILHVPENKAPASNSTICHSSLQNQILWNLFSQNIDRIIIYLMSCPQKVYWGVTLVQLIALLYKDQHVGTLQKLLNFWLESTSSDSSDDNESNTSPPEQESDDFSPVITSDPTSDSSDNGGIYVNKCNSNNTKMFIDRDTIRIPQNRSKSLIAIKRNKSVETESSSGISSMGQSMECNDVPTQTITIQNDNLKRPSICQSILSEISDCGYVTQVENQESISTSSNEEDIANQKRVHQKPPNFQKTRYTPNKSKPTTALEKKELRKKKFVKRRKINIISIKGLVHHQPTDEDIANIIKEFTVDFLLKGYGVLVNDLYTELLSYMHVQIDTSHFFWLVTYFLKFAVQLELDLEHITPVLSNNILNYLVFQGIWILEELEISCMIQGIDVKPCLRRLHLVVTAIREYLQAVEAFQKMIHLSDSDVEYLSKLQLHISKLKDLKLLFVLLLRQYDPNIQSRQYLQDLIVTNHCFILFLDNSCKTQEDRNNIMEHLKNFASADVMKQYGLLLEGFKENGEFVNNCIFTMMHHIGGDLMNVETLFQPSILKTFSRIWETEYELCDDWSDLIEYVIHQFINTPGTIWQNPAPIETDSSESEKSESECSSLDEILILFRWTKEEKDNLLKYYNQSKESTDTIAKIRKKYEESDHKLKSTKAVIQELWKQNIITENEYSEFMKHHTINTIKSLPEENPANLAPDNSENDLRDADAKVIKDYLHKENKSKLLLWLQSVLLEACYAKMVVSVPEEFEGAAPEIEASVYYFTLSNLPIPIIPRTSEHANALKYQPFVLLLHKLGFHLPIDTGKIFVRIPNFWTPGYMLSIAQFLGPINKDELKFDVDKMKGTNKHDIIEIKTNIPASFLNTGKYSMPDSKLTPSVCRYTPLPNSTEWIQNILRIRVPTCVVDYYEPIVSTSQLSIAIPEIDLFSTHLPPPELAIARKPDSPMTNSMEAISMDCSHLYLHDTPMVHSYMETPESELQSADLALSDVERNSYCDTASMASDLTRMYVSDEDEKTDTVINLER